MRHVYRLYETRDNLLAPAPSLGICASASQGLGRGGADERGVGGGSREGADGPSVTCHQSAFSDNDAGAGAEGQGPIAVWGGEGRCYRQGTMAGLEAYWDTHTYVAVTVV